jgi:Sec-independent protein translocase protein TatA
MYSTFPLSFLNAMGGSPLEIAVILVAILLLFGADSLPKTLRTLGKWSEQLRRISMDLQQELRDADEPFYQARKEWEKETRDLRVSSSPFKTPESTSVDPLPDSTDPTPEKESTDHA